MESRERENFFNFWKERDTERNVEMFPLWQTNSVEYFSEKTFIFFSPEKSWKLFKWQCMAYQIQNNEYNNQTRRQNNLFIFFSFAHSSLGPTVPGPGMSILFIRVDRVVLKIKTFQGRKKNEQDLFPS